MVQDHGFARVGTVQIQAIMPPVIRSACFLGIPLEIEDKFGESLGGSQASGKSRTSPEVPQTSRKFFGDFPGSSLTVELYSNPGVPRKFPRLPRKFPGLPWRFPGLPKGQPFSGKPDTLS